MSFIAPQDDIDLSRYFLILGNFRNLPNVTELSENFRFKFEMPEGTQPRRWPKAVTNTNHGPILALAFHRHGFNPGRWTIGSSKLVEVCDVQIAERNDESGISRQHLQIDFNLETKCPRLTVLTDRNAVKVTIHEESVDRDLILRQNHDVDFENLTPVTVNFGLSSFQAWRPILTKSEQRSFLGHIEAHCRAYMDALPRYCPRTALQGPETLHLRHGRDDKVYKKLEHMDLGSGKTGSVFQVMELKTKQIFAAKEPCYDQNDTSAQRHKIYNRLQSEYLRLSELSHPHIVRVVDLLVAPVQTQPPWLIMEYIESSLDGLISSLTIAQKLSIVPQLMSAVAFMHGKEYVHRDIKPANILVQFQTHQPIVKLADLGDLEMRLDRVKMYRGTVCYMAPEYWHSELECGKEVDMWAMGLVLLRLFSTWQPAKDSFWVHHPGYGLHLDSSYSEWISEVLESHMAEVVPELMQPLLRGLICECPAERWDASAADGWAKHPRFDEATVAYHQQYTGDTTIMRGQKRKPDTPNRDVTEILRQCVAIEDCGLADTFRAESEAPTISDTASESDTATYTYTSNRAESEAPTIPDTASESDTATEELTIPDTACESDTVTYTSSRAESEALTIPDTASGSDTATCTYPSNRAESEAPTIPDTASESDTATPCRVVEASTLVNIDVECETATPA
ncbi:kinase-like protein [Karstenula rhodostoma CBS 690.94]|uniref:Autophagy-related protein 1 n=1 Tax=Karstenula rhodostoma CBS 690.94 TaxID=1392251 RepID=A0A9P4U6J3_9PLEO|nr:kinase-like protein [Karstenula rhodostoma CBS 690.94]